MTGEGAWCRPIGREFAAHEAVRHSADEYTRGEAPTNTVEGRVSVFKRGVRGTCQHRAKKHLHRYLAEFDFRCNNGVALGVSDADRGDALLSGVVGKRLTYRCGTCARVTTQDCRSELPDRLWPQCGLRPPVVLSSKQPRARRAMKPEHLHETFDVPRSKQRFRELIVYISAQSERDPHFGAIKLNKILYYSDFRAYERFGQPLTGMRYIKLRLGPAPKALLPVRRELIEEGAIRLDTVPRGPYEQDRTVALRAPALTLFTADEIALVDEVIRELWSQNGTEVSDASHDIRWLVMQLGDPMPYELAFLSGAAPSPADRQHAEELAKRLVR